MQTITNKYIF